jgi:hypothetical protein
MINSVLSALAATMVLAGCGDGNQQSMNVSGSAGNVSQSQSGWGNSQSMSIGNVDGKAPSEKTDSDASSGKTGGKAILSTQNDPETGNKQSANVSGSAKVRQSQGGRDNTQSAVVDGSGNISQNQSGRNNSQSLVIGGNVDGGTPSVVQSQTGVNRKQSMKIDGKKVETKDE